jgi:hypothetical protein
MQKQIPHALRTVGWVVFVLGIMTAVGCLMNLTVVPLLMRFSAQLSAQAGVPNHMTNFEGMWWWDHRLPLYGFMLVFGVLQIFAGYALTQAREWARVTLLVMGLVMIPWQAIGPFLVGPIMRQSLARMPHTGPPQAQAMTEAIMRFQVPFMIGMVSVLSAAWVVALIFFVRWLNSAKVKAACAEAEAKG